MAKMYVVYGSEDEGFRFTIGKPKKTLKEAKEWIETVYLNPKRRARNYPIPYRSAKELTEKQIENSCMPDCHGKVVGMYAMDGTWEPLDSKSKGYVYDWVYIFEVKS